MWKTDFLQVSMNEVVIQILQDSAVTQTVLGGLTIGLRPSVQISYSEYSLRVQKVWKLVGGRQTYCNNKHTYFLVHPVQ